MSVMATHEHPSPTSEARGERLEPILPTSSGIVGDLRHWQILFYLEPEFARTVRLCFVFNFRFEPGLESLIVTHDDKVWGLGKNACGCLGNGTEDASWSPIEISVLSGKGVRSFASGEWHVLALTGMGEVYGWGNNYYAQVGKPIPLEIHTPTLVYHGNDPAEEIACGGWHSVCRTRTGAVYGWGRTDEGQTGSGGVFKLGSPPGKVEGLIANLKCCGISCSENTTIAVFENGDVYAWGSGAHGNLGVGSTKHSRLPVRVDFSDTFIKTVACGAFHALALADDGSLFVWGSNLFGQLGIEGKNNQLTPMRHPVSRTTYGRIVDIAVHRHISAVTTENSEVLVWGQYRGSTEVRTPTVVPCSSLQDVFATWSLKPKTPVPLVVTSMTNPAAQRSSSTWHENMANTVVENFDNPKLSDLRFRVEKEIIHAHRSVLEFQSEYYRTMFQGPWKNIKNDIIEVSATSYPVYKAFVQYFYGDEVDLPAAEVLELLDFANSSGEHVLKAKCERLLRNAISVENCAGIYSAAIQCEAKDLAESCCRFAVDNLTAVAQTQDFENLPENILRRFIADAARKGAFRN